jgi:hypothetical protein
VIGISRHIVISTSKSPSTVDNDEGPDPLAKQIQPKDETGVYATMIVCTHEDRVEHIPGLKLAILSLLQHSPGLSIIASFPKPPDALRAWVEPLSNVTLLDDPSLVGMGWNIKPVLMMRCLEEGYSDVLWLDADIIVNRDIRQRFLSLDDKTLVVAPEYYWGPQQGGNHRAITWGLKPGRSLSATANTGIVRATSHHIDLLKAWKFLLSHPAYATAQSQPSSERPLAMISDQEVLTALLGSEQFSHISIDILQRGSEIAQCCGASGYTPAERLSSLFQDSPPLFIHAIGGKPWRRTNYLEGALQPGRPLRERLRASYEYLHLELSPYVAVSRQYQEMIGEETKWMAIHSVPARILSSLFLSHPALQGLPLALVEAGARRFRHIMNGDRQRFKSNFHLESSPFDS